MAASERYVDAESQRGLLQPDTRISPHYGKRRLAIPGKSVGRLLDSLVDIIRPFTERRGLKADRIRLQREEVALEVAKLAINQLDKSQSRINPVPIKELIPLLEKASLEEPDNKDMIQQWASLLAHAATDREVNSALFSNILSQINGTQAKLLEIVAETVGEDHLPPLAVAPFITAQSILHALQNMQTMGDVSSKLGIPKNERHAAEQIASMLSIPGVSLVVMAVYSDGSDRIKGKPEAFADFSKLVRSQVPRESILDVAVLKSLYLLEVERIDLHLNGFIYQGEWVNITRLGYELFLRTRPLAAQPVKREESSPDKGPPSRTRRKKS
jgi:hypothetical protein